MTIEQKIAVSILALSAAHAVGKFNAVRKFIPVTKAANVLVEENITLTKELSYLLDVLNRSEVAAADRLLIAALPHVEIQ